MNDDTSMHYCPSGALTACGKRRETVTYTDGTGGTRYMDEAAQPCPACKMAMAKAFGINKTA